jgi:hypothetical protein
METGGLNRRNLAEFGLKNLQFRRDIPWLRNPRFPSRGTATARNKVVRLDTGAHLARYGRCFERKSTSSSRIDEIPLPNVVPSVLYPDLDAAALEQYGRFLG